MTTIYEIPLTPAPQTFSIQLGTVTYVLNFWWNDDPDGGWVVDIADASGNPIIGGIPLVTGADLLAQYGYLGIVGQIIVQTDFDVYAVPTFTNLGAQSHVFFAGQP